MLRVNVFVAYSVGTRDDGSDYTHYFQEVVEVNSLLGVDAAIKKIRGDELRGYHIMGIVTDTQAPPSPEVISWEGALEGEEP